MLRFHFDCFAVCLLTRPDPEYPEDRDNQPQAELVAGFFKTRQEAEAAVAQNERDLIARHIAWQKESPWMLTCESWEYRASHYEIVPLRDAEFTGLEDSIISAAVLQFKGVGVEVNA